MASVNPGGEAGQKVQAWWLDFALGGGGGGGSQALDPADWQVSPFCWPQLAAVYWDGRGRRTLENCFRVAVEQGTQPSGESFLQCIVLFLFWLMVVSCRFLAWAETESTQSPQGGEGSESVPS